MVDGTGLGRSVAKQPNRLPKLVSGWFSRPVSISGQTSFTIRPDMER